MIAQRLTFAALALVLAAVDPAAAQACPVCDSQLATEIRSGLADDVSLTTLAAISLPFVVMAGIVSLIHFGLAGFRRKP